ncbi:MAG: FAD-binding protein [Pseudanabaenales cyanobacterium]|nr:FAD-binding protein [Pseudanabaenales cyanobacterium]
MQDYLYSWLNIHKAKPARIEFPKTVEELQSLLRSLKQQQQPYNFIGSSHSYNAIQLVDGNVAIVFDGSGLKNIEYDYITHEVSVEAGVTIEELKFFLRPLGRQLLTSGNFMKQRVIGGVITGTHGYDHESAIMADSITAAKLLTEDGELIEITEKEDEETLKYLRVSFGYLGVLVSATLKTKPNEQFRVKQQIFPLSQLQEKIDQAAQQPHALTMFPYSDREDPYVGFISLEKLKRYHPPKQVNLATPLISNISWAIIKLFWKIDARVPQIRPFVQQLIGRLAVNRETEIIITSPDDLDYLYDYHPMLESERNPSLARRFLSSNFTAYNVAVFVPKAQLVPLLTFIYKLGQEFRHQTPPKFFKNSLGVRYVGQSKKCAMAGNYLLESYAVELFFATQDLEFAEKVQNRIAEHFPIRPHWGKTILKSYALKHIDPKVIQTFKQKRQEYVGSGLLKPNLGELESELC